MSRTFKKDRYGKISRQYKNLSYKCRCEYCKNSKYKLKNTINKKEIKEIINDTNNINICLSAIGN